MQSLASDLALTTGMAGRYLLFRLGSEACAIRVLSIQEIIRTSPITALPQLPSHLRGAINLRGSMVPVVDLRPEFDPETATEAARGCIVVVRIRIGNRGIVPMGLVVDAVEDVLSIEESDISPAPEFGTAIDVEFVRGIARVRDQVIVLLDIVRVLAGERMCG